MRVPILIAAAVVLALPATGARLDKKATEEIDRLIKLVSFGDQVGQVRLGELATGGVYRFAVQGDEKYKYYFNAICDDDCANLDLAAFDEEGTELDIDDAGDNAPTLEVQSGSFESSPRVRPRSITIEVRMIACKAEICAWGARAGQVED